MSEIERILEAMGAPTPPAAEVVTLQRPLAEKALNALEVTGAAPSEVLMLRGLLALPNEQLWAIHSVGPGEEYPCLSKEDAERQAQELRDTGHKMKAKRIAKGESVAFWHDWIVNVIPSPWEPAEHFEIMAEEWTTNATELRQHLIKLTTDFESLNTELIALRKDAEAAAKKLRSAEICHPQALDTLINEARQTLAKYLPEGWPTPTPE